MLYKISRYLFSISFLLNPTQVKAQPDSSNTAIANVVSLYNHSKEGQYSLISGTEYIGFSPDIKGHPYLESSEWRTGSIYYDGELYNNVTMLYDLVNDELIVPHFNNFYRVVLVKEKVSQFSFSDRFFKKITSDKQKPIIGTGYYEFLYQNEDMQLIAKRIKTIRTIQSSVERKIEKEFDTQNRYYLIKNDIYYSVKNQRDLISILEDKRKEIQAYIREINNEVNSEDILIKIVEFYDKKM